jgi:hypothetical protein
MAVFTVAYRHLTPPGECLEKSVVLNQEVHWGTMQALVKEARVPKVMALGPGGHSRRMGDEPLIPWRQE